MKSVLDALLPGVKVVINGRRNSMFDGDARPFIYQRCTIVKRTKAGLVQVSLDADPKRTYSFAQDNIDVLT